MSAYRSAYQHIVGRRLAEVRIARQIAEPLMPRLRSIRSARVARAMAGAVGLAGAITTVYCACVDDGGGATYALLGSGAASIGTYVLARLLLGAAGAVMRDRMVALPKLTGELDGDLARIDASHPFHALARGLAGLEMWSTTLPLAAISLLLPLTLHWAFVGLTGSESPESFARWIRISLVIVGHAHLTLMALAIAFARRMSMLTREGLAEQKIHREWAKAWGMTIAVSAVPGLLLLAVPPILTALTGIAFIPFMFTFMRRQVMKERAAIDLAEETTTVRVATDEVLAVSALDEHEAWAELAASEQAPALASRV